MKLFPLLLSSKIEQLTKDWTSKWMDRKAIMEEYSVDINKEKAGVTIDSNLPHLMAMDDDILSTGVVLYHLRVRYYPLFCFSFEFKNMFYLQNGVWLRWHYNKS